MNTDIKNILPQQTIGALLSASTATAENRFATLADVTGGGGIGGSIAANQIAYGSSSNTIAGNANFIYNSTTGFFGVHTSNNTEVGTDVNGNFPTTVNLTTNFNYDVDSVLTY